ncbi:MAG: crossover junction endodeoxyribonuclease RuvC [Candidatus Dormibacteria bacterium]
MRVLGIDPGLARVGVALVEGRPGALQLLDIVCLETSPEDPDARRLHMVQQLLASIISRWRPQTCAVERLFFTSNRTTAMRVSEARGVILATAASRHLPVAEYTPTEVKEAVAGYGAARKPQVMRMCSALLGEAALSAGDDAADACAVAVCHHHRAGLVGQVRPREARSTVSRGLQAAMLAAQTRQSR